MSADFQAYIRPKVQPIVLYLIFHDSIMVRHLTTDNIIAQIQGLHASRIKTFAGRKMTSRQFC